MCLRSMLRFFISGLYRYLINLKLRLIGGAFMFNIRFTVLKMFRYRRLSRKYVMIYDVWSASLPDQPALTSQYTKLGGASLCDHSTLGCLYTKIGEIVLRAPPLLAPLFIDVDVDMGEPHR